MKVIGPFISSSCLSRNIPEPALPLSSEFSPCSGTALRPWACVYACSVMSDSLCPWTVARQAPLFMEFSRQEYWSGLPFPYKIKLKLKKKRSSGKTKLHFQSCSIQPYTSIHVICVVFSYLHVCLLAISSEPQEHGSGLRSGQTASQWPTGNMNLGTSAFLHWVISQASSFSGLIRVV